MRGSAFGGKRQLPRVTEACVCSIKVLITVRAFSEVESIAR